MAEPDIHMHCAHSYDWVARDSMHAVLRYALAQRLPGYGQCVAAANAECESGFKSDFVPNLESVRWRAIYGSRWKPRIENREVAAYIAAIVVQYAGPPAWAEIAALGRGRTYLAAIPLDMRRIVMAAAHPIGYPNNWRDGAPGAYKRGLVETPQHGLCRFVQRPIDRDTQLVQLFITTGVMWCCTGIYSGYYTTMFHRGYICHGDVDMRDGYYGRRRAEFCESYKGRSEHSSSPYNFDLADRHALLE